ncbi:hypothetical protein GCM10018980_55580 [Streptomyces capoamus]|uniref:Uncharacterized protein n=1 Tax=Streptomyces capoamus TaxID=68183 RepID=A0A919F0E1_9ACTN|nr:hypothetical protein GCM10010501_70220 [Streptomyces libani subsp. rufus]GHG64360.1 hypothetical protein GCM10018980_55580 [Streptomyces capoamus]
MATREEDGYLAVDTKTDKIGYVMGHAGPTSSSDPPAADESGTRTPTPSGRPRTPKCCAPVRPR